jgi:hypothetical protein
MHTGLCGTELGGTRPFAIDLIRPMKTVAGGAGVLMIETFMRKVVYEVITRDPEAKTKCRVFGSGQHCYR